MVTAMVTAMAPLATTVATVATVTVIGGPTTVTDTIAGHTMATAATATAPIGGPITATIAPIDTATAPGMGITGPGDMVTATIVRATTDIDCRREGVLAREYWLARLPR